MVTWPPFLYQNYYKGGQVTKPIVKNILLTIVRMSFKELKVFSSWAILASADIKAFVWSHLPAYMLLLIGLTLFYTQCKVFLFSITFTRYIGNYVHI